MAEIINDVQVEEYLVANPEAIDADTKMAKGQQCGFNDSYKTPDELASIAAEKLNRLNQKVL